MAAASEALIRFGSSGVNGAVRAPEVVTGGPAAPGPLPAALSPLHPQKSAIAAAANAPPRAAAPTRTIRRVHGDLVRGEALSVVNR